MTKARDVADLLANGTVDTNELADGLITTAKLADDSVTTAKIPDAAITAAKLDVQGSDIPYDNTTSGISANTLQEAIDYLNVLSGGGSAGAQATYTRDNFTATAGQTVFTTSNGYTLGYVQVFMNGVLLAPSDFTANNESTVVLTVGASAGDEISVVAYDSFAISEFLRVLSISASANTNSFEVKADSAIKVNTPASKALEVNSANQSNYIAFSKNNTAWAWIGDGSSGSDKFTIATYTNEPIALLTGGAERLIVDASGRVTTPSQPAFHASTNSDISWGNYDITFATQTLDRGNHFSGTLFTAPVAGVYFFTTTLSLAGGTTGQDDTMYWGFKKNGANYQILNDNWSFLMGTSGNGVDMTISQSALISLSANDNVRVTVSGVSHTGGLIQAGSSFSGHLVG